MQENYLQFFFVRCILDFPSKIGAVKHCARTKHSLRAVSGKPNLLAPPTPENYFESWNSGQNPVLKTASMSSVRSSNTSPSLCIAKCFSLVSEAGRCVASAALQKRGETKSNAL
jgi:hypothetical protein